MLTDSLAARLSSLRLPRFVRGRPGCAARYSLRDPEPLEQLQHRKPLHICSSYHKQGLTFANRSPSAGSPRALAKNPSRSLVSLFLRLSRTPTRRLLRSGSSRPSTPSSTLVSLGSISHCTSNAVLMFKTRRLARQPWRVQPDSVPLPSSSHRWR